MTQSVPLVSASKGNSDITQCKIKTKHAKWHVASVNDNNFKYSSSITASTFSRHSLKQRTRGRQCSDRAAFRRFD